MSALARTVGKWVSVVATAAAAGAVLVTGCSDDQDRLPRLGASPGQGGGGSQGGVNACTEGAARDCSVTLAEQGAVLSCYHGTQTCRDGRWGECAEGTVTETQRVPFATGPDLKPLAIGSATDCVNNPCDPNCRTYADERPDGGITSDAGPPLFTWTGGSIASLPTGLVAKGIEQPCNSGYDCQFDTRCVNPATPAACAHSVCAAGKALELSCADEMPLDVNEPSCVRQICAADSSCCYPSTCIPHSPCDIGEPLKPTCSGCVQRICAVDPRCCDTYWDASCAAKVQTVCNQTCACPPGSVVSNDGLSCYYFSGTTQTDGFAARQACYARGSGWQLVTISSAAENEDVLRALGEEAEDAWIGLSDSATEGVFSWLSGSSASYRNWSEGEPNNVGEEDCVEFYTNGTWNDETCSAPRAYVCEKPAAVAWTQSCVNRVATTCDATCNVPGEASGSCVSWLPKQTDSACGGFDLTAGVPCSDGIPVCNRGTQIAPAGIPIAHYPANSQQYPKCNPSAVAANLRTCSTTQPIPPGECINVKGCFDANDNNREVAINPQGHVGYKSGECSCKDNWTLYDKAAACSPPGVCERGSLLGGTAASCTYAISNAGNVNPQEVSVTQLPAGVPLTRVSNAAGCSGASFYFDDGQRPTKITLCPESCTTLRTSAEQSVSVQMGCPVRYEPTTVTHTYEGLCPDGSQPQWSYLTWDTSTPADSSIEFAVRVAATAADLTGGNYKVAGTASTGSPDTQRCTLSGPQGRCPVDLFALLDGVPDARNPHLQLRISLRPSGDGRSPPVVNNWRLIYSCTASR